MNKLHKVKAVFKVPHFNDDPLLAHKTKLLHILLWLIILLAIAYTPVSILIIDQPLLSVFFNLALAIATVVALFILHKQHFLGSTLTLIFSLWLYLSLILALLGGLRNPAIISFVVLIMVAGLLLEKRGVMLATGLTLFSCTLIWLLGENGRLPESYITITDAYIWSAIIVIMIACASILYLGVTSLNNALRQAHIHENELAKLVEERTHDLTVTNEALSTEISDHQQTEKALIESESRFRQIFDLSPDAMFLMDMNHADIRWMIIECNEAACIMNGYTREELIGNSIFMLIPKQTQKTTSSIRNQLHTQKVVITESVHRHKNGTIFPVEVASTLVTFNGKQYVLGQDRDITQRKAAEVALINAHEELEQRVAQRTVDLQLVNASMQSEIQERQKAESERQLLIEELEAKNNELEQFTYTVSHDLKSPLITIRGFLNFLENDIRAGKTERALQDIQRILNATDKMQRLLDNLLELSRIGHNSNTPTAVSLNTLCAEAIEMLNGSITQRGVTLKVAPNMPTVFVDAPRFVEVFQNLLGNATKFMGEQAEPIIEVGIFAQTEAEVTCFIQDNGMGIDPKFQDQIFSLFERLNNDIEGTGIGLSLVKKIIETNNGRIWVESAGIGQGTTFYITLPKTTSINDK